MSKKTMKQRIALVAVTALTAGFLSVATSPVANAAAALVTAREGLGFEEAIALANETLLTGKALRVFTGLIQPQTSVSFN